MGEELKVNPRKRFAVSVLGTALALLAISPAASAQKGGATAPRIVTWNCSGCHGVNGNAQEPDFPRLAALDASYLEQRTAAFQAAPEPWSGEAVYRLVKPAAARKIVASSSPEALTYMVGIAHATTPQQAKAAAAWYSAQKPAHGRSANPALVAQGKAVYVAAPTAQGVIACQDCHGAQAEGQATAPRLGGQNSTYLANQLLRFRAGDRPDAPEMTASAKQLDPEQIRAVSAFLASQ
jgi:cytochrome c553